MKSLLYVIITLYMLNYVLSKDCIEIEPKKVSDCTDHELTDEEKKDFDEEFSDFDTCCYATGKIEGEEGSQCIPFKKSEVNNADLIDQIKEDDEITDIKIQCEADSNWLSLSLTFLFFGLLF